MNPEGWTFSRHAMKRALDMAIDAEELRAVLTTPKRTVYSRKYDNCWVMSDGRIAVAVDPAAKVVITVLWDTYSEDLDSLAYRFERGDDDAEMRRIRDRE